MNENTAYASSSGRREHRRSLRSSSGRRVILVIVAALALETLVLVFLIVTVGVQEKENSDLVAESKKLTAELAMARPELEKLREEVEALVSGRLPHLSRLELDKVVPLNKEYVKNVTFSVAGTSKEQHHEFKMVMHNSGLLAVHPRVDVLFFNEVGLQIGVSPIGIHKDGTPTLDMLERGEIRSFGGVVEVVENERPVYFMVRIRQ
ncbi:hypothetical protein [Methylococcus sp. EFPC2]|uniref:hypothetical protein n=1 Tax=Methylococcus sp. EFPC2 TaxID=2812648 RepID=UPI00196739A4|nr:hypothetical protein [Methylococcus sp. EFPC2]QSA96479.1 hypothetical protein JWZ97_14820 [Methylococcus sp. EFPC2]